MPACNGRAGGRGTLGSRRGAIPCIRPSTVKLGYSTAFTWVMVAGMGWSVWSLVQSPPPLLQSLGLLVMVLVLTDLISGLLHVILDNPRSLDVGPIRGLAQGFQRHHKNPAKIYTMPLYEHLYVMHLPLTILFFVVLPFGESLLHVVFLSFVAALHLMQMAHLWAHLPPERVPRLVRGLQRAHLILSKPQHDKHHTPPYDKDFCIMTGMCNRPLNVAVAVIGGTTHWWNAIFLCVAVTPLLVAFFLTRI